MAPLTARDIMNPHVITVEADMTVQELATFLVEREISGAPVVDRKGKLLGVVSLTDIAETASEGARLDAGGEHDFYARAWEFQIERDEMNRLRVEDQGLNVSEIMTPTVYTIPPETPVSDIAKTMIAGRIHRLLVAEGPSVVGIVTTMDLLKVIAGDRP